MKIAPSILRLIGLLLLPTACGSPAPPEGQAEDRGTPAKTIFARVAEAPDDVEDFIIRRAGCNHFWGEIGSGFAPREEEVQRALAELRCDSLEGEEARLLEKYSSDEELWQLIDETSDYLGWPGDES